MGYFPPAPKNILDTNIIFWVKGKTLQGVKCCSHGTQDTLCDKQWRKSFNTDIGVHQGNCYLYIGLCLHA